MEKYDIGFMFLCYDLNNGCFYDTFEYFYLFQSLGYNCCFIMAVTPETKEEMMMSLRDRYDVEFESIKDRIYYFDFHDLYYNYRRKVVQIICQTLFVPGSSGFDTIVKSSMLLPFKKIFVMYDRPYYSMSKEFHERKHLYHRNTIVLYDDRIMGELEGFVNIPYRKKINFQIFKSIDHEDNRICLSLYCDHKCYNINYLQEILEKYPDDKFFLYTKRQGNYDIHYYSQLRSDRVTVEQAPIKDFMTKFNKFLYLPSNRGFDPSPRMIAECKYYGKELLIYDKEILDSNKDGGHYRVLDCDNIESITLDKKDEVIKIYEQNS